MSNDENGQDIFEIKKSLIATKAVEIDNRASFLKIFHSLHEALVAQESVQKSTILTIDTLTIWFLRANQYTKTVGIQFNDSEVSTVDLIHIALFICDYLDSGSGALSNALCSLLSRLCQFTNNLQDVDAQEIYDSWLKRIMAMPTTLKSFFVIVEAVMKESEPVAKQLLETYPDFPADCMRALEYNALAHVSSKAFAYVHSRTYGSGEIYVDSWKDLVIQNLKKKSIRANIANNLLPVLFRGLPELYVEFLRDIRDLHDNDIFLVVAKIGHTLVPSFEDIGDFDQILLTLSCSNSNKRLDALEVIVGCIKATELTSQNILSTILSSLCLDVFFKESESPQLRNRYMTLMRKAVLAFKDYITNSEKHLKNNPEDKAAKNGVEVTTRALIQIHNYLWHRMSPTSSYCLLILATDFLQIFIDHGFDGIKRSSKMQKKQRSKVFDIFSRTSVNVLLRMTANNYEDIRNRASLMLQWCPYELFVQSLSPSYDEHLRNTVKLLYSLKGRQSDCAAEVFFTMAQIYEKHDPKKYQVLLITLMEELRQYDFQSEHSESPHGLLTAFALILPSKNDLEIDSSDWYQRIFDFLKTKLAEFWSSIRKRIVDPQLSQNDYLNDHWRVLKELSELTKVLMEFSLKHKEIVITESDFEIMCGNLMEQLAIVSHRGAFSAIHINFMEACKIAMKRGEASELKKWLEQNILLIKSHSQLISRRSGGLPYLITAILNGMASDPKLLHESIRYTFKELLSIASQEYTFDGSETMDIPQVHAYNCMKHLVSEIQNPTVDEFVSAALETSLRNLDHESWSLKNAAVMTFTSLQVRIFGSNKMGDVLPKMNAPLFFLRFPGVSQIILNTLESSLQKVNVVVPVLSILSRLTSHRPDDERVSAFIDILQSKYLGHRVWKVREMTAIAITSLSHTSKIPERAMDIADRILTMSSNNEVHGAFMCIANMVKLFGAENEDLLSSIILKIIVIFRFLTSRKLINWTLLSACTRVLEIRPIAEAVVVVDDFLSLNHGIAFEYPDASRRLCLKVCAEMVMLADNVTRNVSSMIENTKYALQHEDEYEVLFSYLDFWETLPGDTVFRVLSISDSVEDLAQKLLKNAGWTYITARVLNFLVSQNLSLNVDVSKYTPTSVRPEVAVSLFFLQLKNANNFNIDLIRKYSANDQEERTRVTAIHSAKFTMEKCDDIGMQAEAAFVLFQKLFDSSSMVRQTASHALSEHLNLDSSSVVTTSQRFIPFFIQNFEDYSFKVLARELFSVGHNLLDAEKDLQSTQFEVESDNLYMDEVDYHRQIVSMVRMSDEDSATVVNECVKLIQEVDSRVFGQFGSMITVWAYNLHIHSVIGKTANFRALRDDQGAISHHLNILTQKLVEVGYPLVEL